MKSREALRMGLAVKGNLIAELLHITATGTGASSEGEDPPCPEGEGRG